MTEEPHPMDRAVGRKIRLHRVPVRISEGHLGARVGVSFQQIQEYERASTGYRQACCATSSARCAWSRQSGRWRAAGYHFPFPLDP